VFGIYCGGFKLCLFSGINAQSPGHNAAALSLSDQGGVLSQTKVRTNIRSHNLLCIFRRLAPEVRSQLKQKFLTVKGVEIEPLLSTCGDYFVLSRYFHEPQSRIPYETSYIRTLAEGVEDALTNWDS